MNISTLGLMRKNGKLIMGFDAVCREFASEKSPLVGVAVSGDLSPKTLKELLFQRDKAKSSAKICRLSATMDELAAVLGKKCGVIAVTDEGFWKIIDSSETELV